VAEGAVAVHGLTDAFLADKPFFHQVAQDFAAFIADARLVIHNAAFDIGFLNAEYARVGFPPLTMDRVVDTLALARRKHPGASNSLDALCARYGIDNSRRTKHGALLDSEILAEVYIELIGGKQADLGLALRRDGDAAAHARAAAVRGERPFRPRLTAEEQAAHAAFIAGLGPEALWRTYLGTEA
jgi:DNA polymerase-3 subunit epsilon